MRNIVIGLILGLIIGGGVTWAGMRYTLVDDKNNSLGTSSNPLYVVSP